MEDETRKALEGSIRKWESIVAGEGVDEGSDNCPLCRLFYDGGCYGCPVMKATGQDYCGETPYKAWADESNKEWSRSIEGQYCDGRASTPELQKLANDELEFLRGLLPKKEGTK